MERMEFILEVCSDPAKCCSVHPVSTTSGQSVAVVERSPMSDLATEVGIHKKLLSGRLLGITSKYIGIENVS
jgi:hypothetical protein